MGKYRVQARHPSPSFLPAFHLTLFLPSVYTTFFIPTFLLPFDPGSVNSSFRFSFLLILLSLSLSLLPSFLLYLLTCLHIYFPPSLPVQHHLQNPSCPSLSISLSPVYPLADAARLSKYQMPIKLINFRHALPSFLTLPASSYFSLSRAAPY